MCSKQTSSEGGVVALALLAVSCVMAVVIIVLKGVFSVQGFLYSFGLASGRGVLLAPLVRLVTLVALFEIAVGGAMIADYCNGRRAVSAKWAWCIAHGTIFIWTYVVLDWVVGRMVMLVTALWLRYHRAPAVANAEVVLRPPPAIPVMVEGFVPESVPPPGIWMHPIREPVP